MGVTSVHVDNRETYDLSAAVTAQLNAEISAAGLKRSELARTLEMDYGTLSRYLKNEREMPMHVLWAIIDQLDVDEATILKLARERFDRTR